VLLWHPEYRLLSRAWYCMFQGWPSNASSWTLLSTLSFHNTGFCYCSLTQNTLTVLYWIQTCFIFKTHINIFIELFLKGCFFCCVRCFFEWTYRL
jgi:hypothetical protein